MLKSYKTEILPTHEQRDKIRRSIGICRWLYNEYLARNKRLYHLYQRGCLDEKQKHFLTAMDFDKFVNHHLKNTEELAWINRCGSKARKKAITNADGTKFKNINKTAAVRRLEKKLRREQRRLSRKLECKKKKGSDKPAAFFANISKNALKVQKLHHRLFSIRTNYTNQVIHAIMKREPSSITIEDLNVSGMMKNRHLAKAVAACKFYEFRTKLTVKCRERGIELRVVDRFYPSSKTCHHCGHVKSDLKLSDRIYICGCGYTADRDQNAAMNLRDAKEYKIA